MSLPKVKAIIKHYGLQPATKRDFSLLGSNIVLYAYTHLLQDYLGFSYRAVGVIGKQGKAHFMFNERYVARKTGELLKRRFQNLDELIFAPALEIFSRSKRGLSQCQKIIHQNPWQALEKILVFYSQYFLALGLYNSLWRYLGNHGPKDRLSPQLFKRLEKERTMVAALYPKIEALIIALVKEIGKRKNLDGDLLRYFTIKEMERYLKNPRLACSQEKILKIRRQGFYFLLTEKDEEFILTDRKNLKDIYNSFYRIDFDPQKRSFRGHCAYPGIAKGDVYNFDQSKKSNPPKSKYILVTAMTDPKNVALANNALAIITDEGGILSHAAIVSRELKIPCIIGTKIATQVLQNGNQVELDAHKGIIKVLKKTNKLV